MVVNDVLFNAATGQLTHSVELNRKPGTHEIAFRLLTENGSPPAVFHGHFIRWTGFAPGERPEGFGAPEASDGDLVITFSDDNTNPGPENQVHHFQFIVLFDNQVLSLGDPDPAIINEPPETLNL